MLPILVVFMLFQFRKEENDKKFRRFISSDEGQVHMKSLSSQVSLLERLLIS